MTTTLPDCADDCTIPAACNMRSAPNSEEPPNLKATTSPGHRACTKKFALPAGVTSARAGPLSSSSCTFSEVMTTPLVWPRGAPREVGEGNKTHRLGVASGGGLETFLTL